jgi:hypothetical protein
MRCAGTRVRGMTPPVCSQALVTGMVMSVGNPIMKRVSRENTSKEEATSLITVSFQYNLQPGAMTLHLTSKGTKCDPKFFIKWCTAALLAL